MKVEIYDGKTWNENLAAGIAVIIWKDDIKPRLKKGGYTVDKKGFISFMDDKGILPFVSNHYSDKIKHYMCMKMQDLVALYADKE